jgi:hypothetical protein
MMGHNQRPLRKYRYSAFHTTYEQQPDGTVLVTHDDGRKGRFALDGRYLEGDLTQANKHMVFMTGGPDLPDACRYRWGEVPVDINRPSGWPEEQEKALPHQLG